MSRVEANMGGHFGTFKSKKDRILGTDFAFEIGKKKKKMPHATLIHVTLYMMRWISLICGALFYPLSLSCSSLIIF